MSKIFLYAIKIVSIIITLTYVEGLQRNLKYSLNPGCNVPECKVLNGSYFNLIHVEASGPNDTLHYIWSTVNLPSIMVVQTSHDAALEIDWTKLLNLEKGAIWFTETPVQSIGLVLTQVWQYDDSNDEIHMLENHTISLNLTDFVWGSVDSTTDSSIFTASSVASSNDPVFSRNGTFKVEFSAGSTLEPFSSYPHLLFNANSTQMRIILNDLAIGEKDRFAVELLAVSSSTSNKSWHHDVKAFIDDEYSPGVFKIHNLFSPPKDPEVEQNFLMWKPVASIGEIPTVANSSDATLSQLLYPKTIPQSIVSIFFNDTNVTKASWNMSFGTSGDGWYDHARYTSWSVMVGTGNPASEKLSTLAIVVISVGLGAPCVIIVAGGLFLVYKKFHKNDDDELLLG